MRISARNQLLGTVYDLGLTVGATACPIVKATDVMVGVVA